MQKKLTIFLIAKHHFINSSDLFNKTQISLLFNQTILVQFIQIKIRPMAAKTRTRLIGIILKQCQLETALH